MTTIFQNSTTKTWKKNTNHNQKQLLRSLTEIDKLCTPDPVEGKSYAHNPLGRYLSATLSDNYIWGHITIKNSLERVPNAMEYLPNTEDYTTTRALYLAWEALKLGDKEPLFLLFNSKIEQLDSITEYQERNRSAHSAREDERQRDLLLSAQEDLHMLSMDTLNAQLQKLQSPE